jgi:hypothetical protein
MKIHGGIAVLVILAHNYLIGPHSDRFVSNQPNRPSSPHIAIRRMQQAKE